MHFSLSCSAAKALFNWIGKPMFHLFDATGRGPDRPTKEDLTMLTALVRFIQQWKRYNQSLNELSRLGDRELADIGIRRSDIPRLAWNSAHQH